MIKTFLLLCAAVIFTSSLAAADTPPGISPRTPKLRATATPIVRNYGLASLSSVSLSAASFQPWQQSNTWARDPVTTALYFTSTAGFPLSTASLPLPVGALLTELEVIGCDDNSVDGDIYFYVYANSSDGTMIPATAAGSSGTPEATGCMTYSLVLPAPIEVETGTVYTAAVNLNGGTSATRFHGFRALYRLQVSPSPAVATFSDVPLDNPINKFVEALYAAGITAGCGDGTTFCPDSPLTRGQMAVFLSAALGLHFPN